MKISADVSKNPCYEEYKLIESYADKLDASKIFYPPASIDQITDYAKKLELKFSEIYIYWLLLSNGYRYSSDALFPLDKLEPCPIPKFKDKYIWVGDYIGDGSMLAIDKKGNFYKLDHVFGIEQISFKDILNNIFIKNLEEDLKEVCRAKQK